MEVLSLLYLVVWMCGCWYLGGYMKRSLLGHSGIVSNLGDGNTHRLFELPRHVQEALSRFSAALPDRPVKLLFVARRVDQDASDLETQFSSRGLSQEAAKAAAESLKHWFDHCCRLAGTPAGILKLHTGTNQGPRWHTDLNRSWLHHLGPTQPQFKFGCSVRGDGTLLLDLHPLFNRLFQWLEMKLGSMKILGPYSRTGRIQRLLNAFALLGHVHACPAGSMVAWSVCHGANARGLRQVHSEALSNKTHDGRNRVFVQVLPCTLENAGRFRA